MRQRLLVDGGLAADYGEDEARLDREVSRCEKAGPDVAVPHDQAAIGVRQERRTVRAR